MEDGKADWSTQATLEQIIKDPRYHDILSLVKTARNGAVYGAKVRFPHALVYVLQIPPWYPCCCGKVLTSC